MKRKIATLLNEFWRDDKVTANRLNTMTVPALYAALDTERDGARRKSVLNRIHQVLCRERATQERTRLLGKFKDWRM